MHPVTTVLAGLMFALLLAGRAGAADGDPIAEAMTAGNYAEAYCLLRPRAEHGDPDAQYLLGWMYHNGYGLLIDDAKAEHWWLKAAAQGHADAAFALAQLYDIDGRDKADKLKALEYYLQAARQGQEDARQILLAKLAHAKGPVRDRLLEILEKDARLFGSLAHIKADRANLRSGPGTGFKVVSTLPKGTPLTVIEHRGDWMRVGIPQLGTVAWIYARLVSGGPPG